VSIFRVLVQTVHQKALNALNRLKLLTRKAYLRRVHPHEDGVLAQAPHGRGPLQPTRHRVRHLVEEKLRQGTVLHGLGARRRHGGAHVVQLQHAIGGHLRPHTREKGKRLRCRPGTAVKLLWRGKCDDWAYIGPYSSLSEKAMAEPRPVPQQASQQPCVYAHAPCCPATPAARLCAV
jgi:hypothetical protein